MNQICGFHFALSPGLRQSSISTTENQTDNTVNDHRPNERDQILTVAERTCLVGVITST